MLYTSETSADTQRAANMKYEHKPCIEMHDGLYTDMLIEEALNLIYQKSYEADMFNEVYTGIVRAYLHSDCPDLVADKAGTDNQSAGAMLYLAMLRIDYTVICEGGSSWPIGGFDFMPDAKFAVSLHHPDGKTMFDYAPGTDINQAALASIMQAARQIAIQKYNQPELPIRYDA